VISVETQIHGYRQGHELLTSSVRLPKPDQSTIDQLSDVAGPLRPGEMFAPYLSAYPLPSGTHFVLARTWQDLSVARAGCVRTLSLVIPTSTWAHTRSLGPFRDLLAPELFPAKAEQVVISEHEPEPLPITPSFQASELIEALFLEEQKPVAIFDAPDAELIAIRILTALWPSARKRFALSTFALSPRKIEGRNFDLIFAPKDARPKFTDWPGRRIDGRAANGARHRWTDAIVERVFKQPLPGLLEDREFGQIETDESSMSAALRIAFLWDELVAKLDRAPSAALGLLDIANSRMSLDSDEIRLLKPALGAAAQRAVDSLPAAEAWDFIGAIARKMHGTTMATEMPTVAAASGRLARKSPDGALALLAQPDPNGAIQYVVPEIAHAIAENFDKASERALLEARPETLARLLIAGGDLPEVLIIHAPLIDRLGAILEQLSEAEFDAVKRVLLPLVTVDSQLAVAKPLLASLDEQALIAEVRYLAEANGFKALTFIGPIIERAQELNVIIGLRDEILSVPASERRDLFLWKTLTPSVADVAWLLENHRLDNNTSKRLLTGLLRDANEAQRSALFRNPIAESVLATLPLEAADIVRLAVLQFDFPTTLHVTTILKLLPICAEDQRVELAMKALERCLSNDFALDQVSTVAMLLGIVGKALDGAWVVHYGLSKDVNAAIANRNLIAFNQAPQPARTRLVEVVDHLTLAILSRPSLDLDFQGALACAQLFWSADEISSPVLVRSAEKLLPLLLNSTLKPVSILISATFPLVYNELVKLDDVTEILSLIPFFTFDQRKAARTQLVNAFLSSPVWAPGDLALTACLCSDTKKIFERIATSFKGTAYIDRISADLARLPPHFQKQVNLAIAEMHSWGGL
jgi:hypothetical protein